MIRTIASVAALFLTLSIGAGAQEPTTPDENEGDTKADAGDPAALKALQDGIALAMKKKYAFTGTTNIEVGGSPMGSVELTGEHAGKWTHTKSEMMGNSTESYSDGETSISKDPRSGEWKVQKGAGGGTRGGLGMEQISKAVKSAKFDGEKKVGSHVCRVVRAQADPDAMKGMLGGGRRGGAGVIKKSSLRFYIDKEDGRLRRIRVSMDAEGNMGQGAMQFHISSDNRYHYVKGVKVELPAEVKALLEAPQEPKTPEGEGEGKKDAPKSGEGEGSDGKK